MYYLPYSSFTLSCGKGKGNFVVAVAVAVIIGHRTQLMTTHLLWPLLQVLLLRFCVFVALGQVMLYVDGMNGVIQHNETIQWLYSLTASKVSPSSCRNE